MFQSLFYIAWIRLLRAYLLALGASFVAGLILIYLLGIAPETIFYASSTRLSYVVPLFELGVEAGINQGLVIFLWNCAGALVTISFFFAYPLFNPVLRHTSPKILRGILCGSHQMKILCFLPGCRSIQTESLRRLYVWLMIPLLGMILLGIESGMMIATGKEAYGSYWVSISAFLPHGLIEIPAIALAGAVTFSGHLFVKKHIPFLQMEQLFQKIDEYRQTIPTLFICVTVVLLLFVAGMVEAHLTPGVIDQIKELIS